MSDPELSKWIDAAQTAQYSLRTAQEATQAVKEKYRELADTFAVKQKSDGTYSIDFEKLADQLGLAQWLEFRAIADAKYNVSGDAGEKPKVRAKAGSEAAA